MPTPEPAPQPLSPDDLDAITARWRACVPLALASVRDVPALLDGLAERDARLAECYDLLRDVCGLSRPVTGGFQQRAAALMARHGQEGANFPPVSLKAG